MLLTWGFCRGLRVVVTRMRVSRGNGHGVFGSGSGNVRGRGDGGVVWVGDRGDWWLARV